MLREITIELERWEATDDKLIEWQKLPTSEDFAAARGRTRRGSEY
jgi:hypothetical protein